MTQNLPPNNFLSQMQPLKVFERFHLSNSVTLLSNFLRKNQRGFNPSNLISFPFSFLIRFKPMFHFYNL